MPLTQLRSAEVIIAFEFLLLMLLCVSASCVHGMRSSPSRLEVETIEDVRQRDAALVDTHLACAQVETLEHRSIGTKDVQALEGDGVQQGFLGWLLSGCQAG